MTGDVLAALSKVSRLLMMVNASSSVANSSMKVDGCIETSVLVMCTSVKGTVCRVILIFRKIRPRGGLLLTTKEMYESHKTELVSGKVGEEEPVEL